MTEKSQPDRPVRPTADGTAPKGSPGFKGWGIPPQSAPATKPAAGSKRTWKSTALVGGLAAGVLFGGGTLLGTTLPDPTASELYVMLQDSKAAVEGKNESLRKGYKTLEMIYLQLKGDIESREVEVAVKKREEDGTGAEAIKAKNTFGDGTWTVGRDIEPGTYIPTADLGSSCYWAILAKGTNGSDIVDNDIPGGGRPSVTLSEGQDFKSSRCGSWTKQ